MTSLLNLLVLKYDPIFCLKFLSILPNCFSTVETVK